MYIYIRPHQIAAEKPQSHQMPREEEHVDQEPIQSPRGNTRKKRKSAL